MAKDPKDTDYFSKYYKTMPLKKISYLKKCKDSATRTYKDLKILKFRDHITQQNCIFVFSLEQNPQLLSSWTHPQLLNKIS